MTFRRVPIRAALRTGYGRLQDAIVFIGLTILILAVGFLLVTQGGSWIFGKYEAWGDARFLDRYAGKQAQRHVVASAATHEPFRYVIEKCLSGDVHRVVKSRLAGCRGNVKVLAGNDQMLGRGDLSFASFSDGTDSQIGVEFGSTADVFDAAELMSN